jgi:RNA polymerase sigma factor (sigma-70 family)
MATSQMSEVLQQLRRAELLRDQAGLSDGQLLGCFVVHQEEAALEALVRRHGPMVWGVCRRVLNNHHDAEDAFQATFLVLVRKAASINPREMVANWLYGVAHQTALRARAAAAKRRTREKQVAPMPEPKAVKTDPWDDLQSLLDQALTRLPDKYRVAIVLCDLEGKTRKEAAEQLGIPEGTMASRHSRARTMLAKQLASRGVVLSVGALPVVLSQNAASACVPASVVSSTIKVATLVAAGQAVAPGLISAKVAALTEGVLKTMLLNKLKTVTTFLLVLGLAAFGGGLLKHQLAAGQQTKPEQNGSSTLKAEKLPAEDNKADADAPAKNAAKTDKIVPAQPVQAENRPSELKSDNAEKVKDVVRSPFRVTVDLQRKPVRVKQPFKVSVQVVNSSQSRQSFQVANGNWEMHWKPSNDRVYWVPRAVFRNFIETVNLDPGQAYQKTGYMVIAPEKPQKEVTFKLGFTPAASKQTYWSDEVTLQIESESP